MELRQLRYFVRIVELGSLSRAAADLFVAQPALSQQLSHLEADLGVRLLARSVRGVSPTEAGQVFYRHAQSVLRMLERIRVEVQDTSDQPSGVVSIGMPTSVANILATPLVAAARQRFPQVRLQIVESLSGHLEDMVATGRIEMTLLFESLRPGAAPNAAALGRKPAASHLQVRPILIEELFVLTAGDSHFGEPMTLREAAALPLAVPGRANATRQIVDAAFAAEGLEPLIIAELDSLSTIKSVVAAGIASTILSASALAGATRFDGVKACRIRDQELRRRVSLCTYDIVALGRAAECVADLAVSVSRTLVVDGAWIGATLIDET